MMRESVQKLVALGKLPSEKNATVESLEAWENLFDQITRPVTNEEAVALVQLFGQGPDSCFGLAWSLLHLIETAPGWPILDHLFESTNPWVAELHARAQRSRLL